MKTGASVMACWKMVGDSVVPVPSVFVFPYVGSGDSGVDNEENGVGTGVSN